ncbi:MAG: hypothetical protein ACPGLY_23515 [Rubripirellula sp.]
MTATELLANAWHWHQSLHQQKRSLSARPTIRAEARAAAANKRSPDTPV